MSTFERNEGISRTSWINDFVMDKKTAGDLTSTYVDDVLQAVQDKDFSTLRAAIDDLAGRVGLGAAHREEIRKVASLKYNPKLLFAMDNINTLSAGEIQEALDVYGKKCEKCSVAPCSCEYSMSATMKQAMEEVGVDKMKKKLAFLNYKAMATPEEKKAFYDEMAATATFSFGYVAKGDPKKEGPYFDIYTVKKGVPGFKGGEKTHIPGTFTGYKLECASHYGDIENAFPEILEAAPKSAVWQAKKKAKEEGRKLEAQEIEEISANEKARIEGLKETAPEDIVSMAVSKCHRTFYFDRLVWMKVEGGKYADFRKDVTKVPTGQEPPDEILDSEPGGMKVIGPDDEFPVGWNLGVKKVWPKDDDEGGAAASAKAIYLQKIAGADFKKIKQIKEELGCSQGEAMKEYWKREKAGRDKKVEDGEGNDKVVMRKDKKEKGEDKEDKKDKKEDKKEDKKDSKDDKKEKDMEKDASNKTKWNEFFKKKGWFQGSEESVDKIVSNDPSKLGYPKDVEYPREPMAVPVGQDARPWEQKWFEGAADETKKVMGPSGAEKKEREHWQRAAWKAFLEKKSSAKK